MKKNDISYPYPVLGIGDDILPLLEEQNVKYDIRQDNSGNYIFTFELIQNDNTITQLINEGKAEYMVEVDCVKTLFHKNYVSNTSTIQCNIPQMSVLDTVHFYPVIIAKTDIDNYSNPNFNSDYENATFNLTCGNILACFNQLDYNVSIKYNKLMAFDSFMQIRRSETADIVTYELDTPKINIVLPSAMYDQYLVFGQDERYEEVIHSSIVLNALLYALQITDWYEEMQKEDRELWKDTIIYRCTHEIELMQYKLTDPFNIPCIAQALLKDPFKRMFNKLEQSENLGFEND